MTVKEKFEKVLERYIELEYDQVLKAMQIAFDMGRASKKCKEDNDNPYNIDYERQTKLDL